MTRFFNLLFGIIDGLIPPTDRYGSEESLRTARIIYVTLFLIILNDLGFGILGLFQGDKYLPQIILSIGVGLCFTPLLTKIIGSMRFAATTISVLCTIMLISTGLLSGGLHSSAIAWLGALAVFILVTLGTPVAMLWTTAIAVGSVVLWWFTAHGYVIPDYENPESKLISWAIAFPAGIFLILSMLHSFFEAHRRAIFNLDLQTKTLVAQTTELINAKAIAENASRSRSEFIATVSHEIRTPMNGILGVAQLLKGTALAEEQRKYLDALQMSAEGLLSILGDILDFSKIEAGKLEVRKESVHLKTLCEDCLAIFSGLAQSKPLELGFTFSPSLPHYVNGDPVRIRQVLINLIGNAVKFTDKGFVNLEVSPVNSSDLMIQFLINDNGIGMSPETLKILFQPYTQADASSSRKYGGTGLGLAICQRLTSMMGGTISVESELGHGSKFKIVLPLAKAVATKIAIGEIKVSHSEKKRYNTNGNTLILLVEDNPINRMVAIKILEKLSVKVEVATNGLEAVEKFVPNKYSLIFMDCQMPGMDGYDATQKIRQIEKASGVLNRLPIIALTAHAMEEDRQRCLDAGMDEYLTKPVKSEQLQAAMETWI